METMVVQPDGSIEKEPRETRKVRALAAEMLHCARAQIHVQQLDAERFLVAGCDQNITLRCFTAKRFECNQVAAAAPPIASASAAARPFDSEAARGAMFAVAYSDCGTGGAGKVEVTFAPQGAATKIEIVEGVYDDKTSACVVDRYRAVKVPSFEGEAHVVRWTLKLP